MRSPKSSIRDFLETSLGFYTHIEFGNISLCHLFYPEVGFQIDA